MSSHLQKPMAAEEIYDHLHEFEERNADVVKIVPLVNTRAELLESIRATMLLKEKLVKPFIHVCNGAFGRHQRTIAPMLGEMLLFGMEPTRHTGDVVAHLPVSILRDIETAVYEHIDPEL